MEFKGKTERRRLVKILRMSSCVESERSVFLLCYHSLCCLNNKLLAVISIVDT